MQLWVLHKRTGIIWIRLRHRSIRIRRGATAAAARGRQRLGVLAVILGHHNAHDHSDNDDRNQHETAANHLAPSVKTTSTSESLIEGTNHHFRSFRAPRIPCGPHGAVIIRSACIREAAISGNACIQEAAISSNACIQEAAISSSACIRESVVAPFRSQFLTGIVVFLFRIRIVMVCKVHSRVCSGGVVGLECACRGRGNERNVVGMYRVMCLLFI